MAGRGRTERGFSVPSWVTVLSAAAVAIAVLGFFITGSPDPTVAAATGRTQPSTPVASVAPPEKPITRKPEPPKPVRDAYVEVYNNSGITGLADATAGLLQARGWDVVGTDNWYGDIVESTVYHPSRLRKQAQLLADDLGIERVRPAISPMRFDRLTVILTDAV